MEARVSTIADKLTAQVAQAIKTRREQLGLTLRALAARSGVSASMVSDLERGTKSPTIATLAAIAEALGLPVSALVDIAAPPTGRIRVVRAAERSELVDPKSGARRDSFGPPLPGSKVEFLRYTVPPRTVAGPFAPHVGGTIEHMHLAKGRMRAVFGADEVMLEAGDSCACVADTPHRFDNSKSKVEALIYLVVERS
jgi:transcriptional regulator with XRE-family HTH domain